MKNVIFYLITEGGGEICFFRRALLNANGDDSYCFNIGKMSLECVNALLCQKLQNKRYSFIVLRKRSKLMLKKSGLLCTYDPLFIQTENSNEIFI